ncbi:hypothetical protein SPI_01634 [Niveomyces insectorum RCEF 264]|uniref:Hemerythrin-like domain-containing protein n=1 Tax=Niveomyces insectorum RCEF 264 TaxID=1081102 RepID=A0A167Z438_9HYPO|nr:hypothetical protein SPI_01634 [Niveomyces insectorum RCEF 264]
MWFAQVLARSAVIQRAAAPKLAESLVRQQVAIPRGTAKRLLASGLFSVPVCTPLPRPRFVATRAIVGADACLRATHTMSSPPPDPSGSADQQPPASAGRAKFDCGDKHDTVATPTGSQTNRNEPAGPSATQADEERPQLPALSPAEFREYNQMAEHMDLFVWTMIYNACVDRKRPAGMSIREFLNEGLQFVRSLTMHHSIEESYVFPMLAERMPEFQAPGKGHNKGTARGASGAAKAAELVQQHRAIHVGMDGFEAYLQRCRNKEVELQLSTLKEQMDTWGGVLWKHLDEEVATLGAENMRKYWSLDDMRQMRM